MQGVRAGHCARHRSIGREKTGKILTIKGSSVAYDRIARQEEQTPKDDRFMPSLLVLSLQFKLSCYFNQLRTSSKLIILYIIYFNFSTNFSTSQWAIKHGFLLARQNFY